jgi:orotate phosphoribosyltransferase
MSEATLERLPARIAGCLLDIGAVTLRPHEPFTWTSGLRAPIYCDNRLTISYPAIRDAIAEGFAALIRVHHPDCEAVAGIATGGIPHAAWVAQKLGLPMLYVREKPKGHGKTNQIEGHFVPGQKLVLIEDLVSTGGSSLKAALAVREAGADVLGVLAIFTYQFAEADRAFAEAGVPLRTLTHYSALIEEAVSRRAIREEDVALLQAWRENPRAYGQS